MALLTDIQRPDRTLASIFSALRNAVVSAWQRRRAYVRTFNELDSLTERELADLGVRREDIDRLAREAAQY